MWLVTSLAFALAAVIVPRGGPEAKIVANIQAQARAFSSKDFDAAYALTTKDFTERFPDGSVLPRAKVRSLYEGAFRDWKAVRVVYTVMSVTVKGPAADVETRWTVDGSYEDATGAHTVHMEGSEAHVWVLKRGRWLQRFIDEHDESTFIDGKLVDRKP